MRQTFPDSSLATVSSAIAAVSIPLGRRGPVALRGSSVASRAASWLGRVRATIRVWQERARGRQELRELDDYVLRDIGITRLQAEAEAGKPFWRE